MLNSSGDREKDLLWSKYVGGDKSAFGRLYALHHKSLTAFCVGRLKDLELAENAASETLIKLLQYPRPMEIENFENWLFTVAKNECNTVWSTAERRERLMKINYEVKANQNPEVDNKFSAEGIDQLIRQNLDETDYKIWMLHLQGYDNNEIAEITNSNEKTVANRKSAARAKLKLTLKNYDHWK